MSKHQESRLDYIYRVVVPKVTSIGAALVVVGAMFKIMHWPGAGQMLVIGLSTEAFLFFLGAFQPPPPPEVHYHWENVHPELVGATGGGKGLKPKEEDPDALPTGQLAVWMKQAGVNAETFKSFGTSIQKIEQNAKEMKDMSSVASATNEYTKSVKIASQSLNDLNKAYSGTVNAMSAMANASKDAKEYHNQVQVITKNLGALNAVYEMELKDANSHLKAMNKFYSNLTTAMENMSDATKESEAFKKEMKGLTSNLTSLNKIYGNMLAAMKG